MSPLPSSDALSHRKAFGFSKIYSRPLIPMLLAFMGGEIAGFWLADFSGFLLAISAVFGFLTLFLLKRKRAPVLLVILLFSLGHWTIQRWVRPKLPTNHVSHYIEGKRWRMIGTIKGRPQHFAERTRFVLESESLSKRGILHEVTGAVRVTLRGRARHLREGDRVACSAKLKEPRNFNNPGGFDYRQYLALQGIWATASVSNAGSIAKIQTGKNGRFLPSIAASREAASGLIEEATRQHPKSVRGVLKALLMGDRAELSHEIRELFSRIGTSHLLAISGLHIGIVATLFFWGLRLVLGRSERLLLGARASKAAALLSLAPVLFYGCLAGMSPATQRAVIMVVIFLLALLFERERDPINTLAVAALVILAIKPASLFSISFQLSFSAVFSILYMLGNVSFVVRLKSGSPTLLTKPSLFLCVSAAAILGTLPITLYYFNQMSLIGLLTNCFMVPLIGFLVVPMGLLSVLLLPVGSSIALWPMKGAALTLESALNLAVLFSKWPFAAIRMVTPSLIEIAIYYALVWVLIHFRRNQWAKYVLLSLSVLLLADMAYWIRERFGRHELRATAIDVGQGSSALLEFPGGPCMLVDGGGFYDNRFDVGARVVAPFLWKKKIATVDIVVLSHPHPDHLNGLIFIVRHFNVREVWINGEFTNTGPCREFLEILRRKDIREVRPKELTRPRVINRVLIEVLYPPSDFLCRKERERWRTRNNNSLVLKISQGDVSFLLPGDIETEAEKELVRLVGHSIKSHVLLAPHHGSKSSSTASFLRCVQPDKVVISCGWKNIFRFPHESVLKRYQETGCEVFRTDLHGAVTVSTDGKDLRTKPYITVLPKNDLSQNWQNRRRKHFD